MYLVNRSAISASVVFLIYNWIHSTSGRWNTNFHSDCEDSKDCQPRGLEIQTRSFFDDVSAFFEGGALYNYCKAGPTSKGCLPWKYYTISRKERNKCWKNCGFGIDLPICANERTYCLDSGNLRFKRDGTCKDSKLQYKLLTWKDHIAENLNKLCGLACGVCPECASTKQELGYNGCRSCTSYRRCRYFIDSYARPFCAPATREFLADKETFVLYSNRTQCISAIRSDCSKDPKAKSDCIYCVNHLGLNSCAFVYSTLTKTFSCRNFLQIRSSDNTVLWSNDMCNNDCDVANVQPNPYRGCLACTRNRRCHWHAGRCKWANPFAPNPGYQSPSRCVTDCTLLPYNDWYNTRPIDICLRCTSIGCGFVNGHGEVECHNRDTLIKRMPWEYVTKQSSCYQDCAITHRDCESCTSNGCIYLRKNGLDTCRHRNAVGSFNTWDYANDTHSCDCYQQNNFSDRESVLERCQRCTRAGCVFVTKNNENICYNKRSMYEYSAWEYVDDPVFCSRGCAKPLKDDWIQSEHKITNRKIWHPYYGPWDMTPIWDCTDVDVKAFVDSGCDAHLRDPKTGHEKLTTFTAWPALIAESYGMVHSTPMDVLKFSVRPHPDYKSFRAAIKIGYLDIKKTTAAFIIAFTCPLTKSQLDDARIIIQNLRKMSITVTICGINTPFWEWTKETLANIMDLNHTHEHLKIVSMPDSMYFECINPHLSQICPQPTFNYIMRQL